MPTYAESSSPILPYVVGALRRKREKDKALSEAERAERLLTGNSPTLETRARGAFPGMTQANIGGILSNAIGTGLSVKNQLDAEKNADMGNEELLGVLKSMGIAAPASAPMEQVKSPVTPINNPGQTPYDEQIAAASAKYGIPVDEIKRQIQIESSFNPNAVSPKGAQGLMQLMPATQQDMGVTNPLDPAQNIDAGVRYQRQLLDQFGGDKAKARAAYNWGPTNMQEAGEDWQSKLPPETRNYLAKMGISPNGVEGMDAVAGMRPQQGQPRQLSGEELFLLSQVPGINTEALRYLAPQTEGRNKNIDNLIADALAEGDMAKAKQYQDFKLSGEASGGSYKPTETDITEERLTEAFVEKNGRKPNAQERARIRQEADNRYTPQERKQAETYGSLTKQAAKQELAASSAGQSATKMIEQLDYLINSPDRKAATGLSGYVARNIPMTDWSDYDISAKNLSFKSMAEGLKELRAASGSPGTITEKEWPIMANLFTELSLAQTEDRYLETLQKIKAELEARTAAEIEKAASLKAAAAAQKSGSILGDSSPTDFDQFLSGD